MGPSLRLIKAIIDRVQLLALGLHPSAIDRCVSSARLYVLNRVIYALGHRVVTLEGPWMTAVHASGPGTVLSHLDAAALLGLRPPSGSMYAIVPSGSRRRRPGPSRWPSLEATGADVVGILALGPLALGCAALSLRCGA